VKRLQLFLTPLLLASTGGLAGCLIPVDSKLPAGPPVGSAAPIAASGLPTRLDYAGGPIALGTAEARGLLPLIKDERGQIVAWPLTWSSTAANVVSVDATGAIKGLTQGSATIVVALQGNPAVRAQIPVTVGTNRSSLGVTITPASPTIALGDAPLQLIGQVQLADGQVNANVLWSSSDSTIATVNPTTGPINGLRAGTVTINGTYALDDKIRGQATVRVVAAGAAPSAQPSAVIFRPGAELGGEGAAAFALNDGWTRDRIIEKGTVSAIDFVDATTGFAVGETGRILTSFDSGVSWQPLAGRGLANQGAADVDFLDAQTGYLAGGSRQLLRTRDGGQTWTPVGSFENAGGVAIGPAQAIFLDATTGWTGGSSAAFKTTDAGESWGRVNTPADLAFAAIAVGGGKLWLLDPGMVHTYADGAWRSAPVIKTTASVAGPGLARMVAFPTAADGWAAGSNGTALVLNRTTDGGRTWTPVDLFGPNGQLLQPPGARSAGMAPVVGFADARHGVVALGDQAYSTTDGGFSWARKDLAQHYVQQIRALDARHFFLLATPGSSGSRPADPAYLLQFDGR